MKYLLYYNLDSEFVNDQTACGGDGSNVVSVVDGVAFAWTDGHMNDERVYYRYAKPNDTGSVTSYTVTVHYTDSVGKTLAQDDVYTVDTYIGKSAKFFIAPKSIENYVPIKSGVSVTVSSNTEYNLIYRKDRKEMLNKPLTFNVISSGTISWVASNASFRKAIYYSKNGGSWSSITSNTSSSAPAISVSAGDSIQFKGDNAAYATSSYFTYFSASTGTKFSVEGNIMSLINSTGFSTATTLQTTYTFSYLFNNCDKLIRGLDLVLPATTLGDYCYNYMFHGCKGLTSAPELPATTLANYCYSDMFDGCTSLTAAPALPATTLANNCYYDMFYNCTSLTTAPELPATTLANGCYSSMFAGCTSLTTAPELPATTLANGCYSSMFHGCKGLTSAPELPATTLAQSCYQYMFQSCTNLNYIKCLATNRSATYCTADWVSGVQTTSGTFVKNPAMSSWSTGNSGIPNNWTVQNAS